MAVENRPLMPKATAVWLVDNTSLTFEQIADFCGLHPLEVKGIADEDVAKGIKGQDPVSSGQLTREQIEEAEKNPKARLKMAPPKHKMPSVKQKKAPRYTPVSKRQDKPDAVYWILRNHPEFADADIIKLIGTTKATIQKIRERSHWNATNIKAVDPVTLGLCSQLELDLAVTRAAAKRDRALKRAEKAGATLKPISETVAREPKTEMPKPEEPGPEPIAETAAPETTFEAAKPAESRPEPLPESKPAPAPDPLEFPQEDDSPG
ncbi:MAG TPA: cell cycle transcriptional regulator TrcR [Rhizomicrobium sp.]|jgi:hypothetical protein